MKVDELFPLWLVCLWYAAAIFQKWEFEIVLENKTSTMIQLTKMKELIPNEEAAREAKISLAMCPLHPLPALTSVLCSVPTVLPAQQDVLAQLQAAVDTPASFVLVFSFIPTRLTPRPGNHIFCRLAYKYFKTCDWVQFFHLKKKISCYLSFHSAKAAGETELTKLTK